MRWFDHRRVGVIAAAFVSMATVAVATPGISSAACDPNMSWNPMTGVCKPPPPVPDWYRAPVAYAPNFAAQDVPPPPPPRPLWADSDPMWSAGFHQWGIYINGVWVPV